MNKVMKHAVSFLMALFVYAGMGSIAYASDGQEYITISVDAEDNNGNLMYALDTDDPGAFSPSNEFSVPAGTNHTIYVKDSAGNITAQEYVSSEGDYDKAYFQGEDEERTVNIDITLDDIPKDGYEYAGDLLTDPAEDGQGTVHERVETQANDPDAKRIFYTVTTDEGEVFYLVIDQNQNSNNVYLLDQVNLSDLHALAVNDSGKDESDDSTSLLSALSGENDNETIDAQDLPEEKPKKNSMTSNLVIILIVAAIGGGVYYYKNIYKNKRDEQMDVMDAPDKDDFAVEEEDEDEEDFGLEDDYQDQIMSELLGEDDSYADSREPEYSSQEGEDVYATSHKNEETIEDAPETDAIEDEYDDELDAPDEEEEE